MGVSALASLSSAVCWHTSHMQLCCSAVEERVVISENGQCTTSRGPGTAFEFALALVAQLCSEEKKAEVAGPMVMYRHQA